MDFKIAYLEAMREQAPQMFNELRRSGAMDSHLTQKSAEAHRMLEELTAGAAKEANGVVTDPQVRASAERQVLETLIEFPPTDGKRNQTEAEPQQQSGPMLP